MKTELLVPPATLPIPVTEIKGFMRIIDDSEDGQIEQMVRASIKRAENITNLQLGGVATFVLWMDTMPSLTKIKVPNPPLVAVEEISYQDTEDAWQTLDPKNYWVDTKATPGEITFVNHSPAVSPKPNAVKIVFQAGYETIPTEVVSWVKIMAGTLYEHRERFVVGTNIDEFSSAYIDGLLDSLRIVPI